MCIAECDVLRDENIAMAALLAEAGVAVRRDIHHGASHSFLEAVSLAAIAEHAFGSAAAWLAAAPGAAAPPSAAYILKRAEPNHVTSRQARQSVGTGKSEE